MSLSCPQCGRLHSEFDPRCLSCGTPLPTSTVAEPSAGFPAASAAAALGPGSRLDRFELLAELGRGGMGVVYRARDTELGREVALKLLSGRGERRHRERVLREARAVAALDHPAIGTLYEVGAATAGSFLVLALYEGRTLAAELAERGPLPPAEALAALEQLAGALAAAHAAGILHRDVKPSNVFRLPDGRLKLLDFGIALGPEDDRGASSGHRPIGTAAYMAPERLRGEESGGAADVFSLGVLGWEAATGGHPFDLERPGWLERLATGQPAPVTEPGADFPPGFAALLRQCLAADPAARPDAATLAERLAALAGQLRRPAAPPPAFGRGPRLVAAGAALLGLATAAFFLLRPGPNRVVAVLPPHVAGTPGAGAGENDRLAANLEATTFRTLLQLEGLEALDRNLARQATLDPVAAARAMAADETLAWEASCPGVDLCRATVWRRDAAGRVLGSESLELSESGDALSARAAAAALRRVYGERRLKGGPAPAEPEPGVYQAFLELRTALDRRRVSPEEALERLAALRREAPPLPELAALEAGLCRFLLARDREEKWLARGLEVVTAGLEGSPADPTLLAVRVDLLLQARRLDQARAALATLERSGAGLAEVFTRRARLAEAEGRPEEALALLERLARDRPAAYFLLSLANLEERLGRNAEARAHLEQATEKAPENVAARAQLAGLDLSEGRLENAAEGWRRLVELAPTGDALGNYGLALMLLRRYGEAEAAYRRALALAPRQAETRLNLADALELLGRRDEAAGLYRDLVAEPPADFGDSWQLWAVRAQAAAQLGQPAEARAALAEMLRRAPENGAAALSAALVHTLLGDHPAALAEARRAAAAGNGGVWLELPFFDPLAAELEAAGLRRPAASAQG